MKTITLSDNDYDALMALSKELQEQENDGQAFPYFWVPASDMLQYYQNDCGDVIQIYDCNDHEVFTPKEFADHDEELYLEFVESRDKEVPFEYEYDHSLESGWVEFLEYKEDLEIRTYTENWEHTETMNPSFFKSDVKDFIKYNKHHLGEKPRTYAHTLFRMPKMEQLINIMYRLNPQPKESVNHEAARIFSMDGEK